MSLAFLHGVGTKVAERGSTSLPSDIKYYNNFNGTDINNMSAKMWIHNGTEWVITPVPLESDFTWGDKKTVKFENGFYFEFFHENYPNDIDLSNGFSVGCWYYTPDFTKRSESYKRYFIYIRYDYDDVDPDYLFNDFGVYTDDQGVWVKAYHVAVQVTTPIRYGWNHFAITAMPTEDGLRFTYYVNGAPIQWTNNGDYEDFYNNANNFTQDILVVGVGTPRKNFSPTGYAKNVFFIDRPLTEEEMRQMLFVD